MAKGKSKKKKPHIRRKSVFKASPGQFSVVPMGFQEHTGEPKDFPNIGPWLGADTTKQEAESDDKVQAPPTASEPTGRTIADVLRELFIEGQIGILFTLAIGGLFFVILYQDNAANRWETWTGIFLSFRKIGISVGFLLLIYGLMRFFTRKSRQ